MSLSLRLIRRQLRQREIEGAEVEPGSGGRGRGRAARQVRQLRSFLAGRPTPGSASPAARDPDPRAWRGDTDPFVAVGVVFWFTLTLCEGGEQAPIAAARVGGAGVARGGPRARESATGRGGRIKANRTPGIAREAFVVFRLRGGFTAAALLCRPRPRPGRDGAAAGAARARRGRLQRLGGGETTAVVMIGMSVARGRERRRRRPLRLPVQKNYLSRFLCNR